VTDASDGGIVIFGSPGSIISNNQIIAATQTLMGALFGGAATLKLMTSRRHQHRRR